MVENSWEGCIGRVEIENPTWKTENYFGYSMYDKDARKICCQLKNVYSSGEKCSFNWKSKNQIF